MAHQFTVDIRNGTIDPIETLIGGSALMELRQGVIPADPSLADTGTLLATIPMGADPWTTAANGVKTLNPPGATTASANGVMCFGRIKTSGGITKWQFTISDAWAGSKAYILGQHVLNGANLYRCTTPGTSAASGGPTGTGASITDGTVTWTYVQVGADVGATNTAVSAGQQIPLTALTITATGA
jgi:hypothetical protein